VPADRPPSLVHLRPLVSQASIRIMSFPSRMALLLRLAITALVLLAASHLDAQQLPTTLTTPEQARRLLETRPDLIPLLRREIAQSGLTPEQIRTRLRAAGYPEDLLDAYLEKGGGRDSLGSRLGSDGLMDAVAALGAGDSVDTAGLRAMARGRTSSRARDVLGADAYDALDMPAADPLVRMLSDTRLLSAARRRRAVENDSGFTIFGLNVFSGSTTQFDPNLSGPVDANYRLGPGDRLVLILTGDAERSFTLDVTREGFIVLPGVGELSVANLTLGQLEDILYARLGRVYSGLRRGADATTHFSLNLARLHSNQVFVLGDVDQPGSYRVSSAGTALTALYAAGGPTINGSMRRVEIRRAGRLVDSLDLYDYLLRADGSHDSHLQSGDVVFVPVHGARVRVQGEVIRPATYELRRGETLADVLRSAGGFTAEAARRRVQIARILPPTLRDTTDRARVVIDIASDQFSTGTGPAYPLEPGDVIRVFTVNDRVGRRVAVQGDVWTPGAVGFTPGMRISEAIRLAGGLKPDAYLGQLLVSRLRGADSTRVQLRTSFVDSTGRVTEDMPLRDDDEIHVFSTTEFRTPEFVEISGAVRRPGRVPYSEGMTLRDLVLLAGGLDDRAFLGEAEIARLPRTRDGGRLADSRRVPLDSSYLFIRDQGRSVVQSGSPRSTPAPTVELEPFDNVRILVQPDWEAPRSVSVSGEVRSPGIFTLTNKQDRLSDVIARAGGLTTAAYADGIIFYRRRAGVGRIGVDLPRVLRDAAYRDNLTLQDGDSIYLPPFAGIVQVQGAVNAPRGVAYVPGEDLMYYVRAAGGPTKTADPNRAYVTQPDGSVESYVERMLRPDVIPEPKPGSVVVVTEKETNTNSDTVAKLGVLAQLVGAIVTLVVVAKR
jgi:polysaccharide biosynthesis/export protein